MNSEFDHSNILENHYPALVRHFLIATCKLSAANFRQSVVYLHKVTDTEVTGIIINKPLQHHLSDLMRLQDVPFQKKQTRDQSVLNGGPSFKDQGFIVYSDTVFSKNSEDDLFHETQDINISTSRDMLEDIAYGKGPRHTMVAIGCMHWGIRQFIEELTIKNYWLIAPANKHILFKTPSPIIWQTVAASIGIDSTYLSSEIGYA